MKHLIKKVNSVSTSAKQAGENLKRAFGALAKKDKYAFSEYCHNKKPNTESAHDVFTKASKVISSCQTNEQLRVALNYKLMAVSHILKIAPNRVYEYSVFLDEVMNKATTKVVTHGI